MARNFHCRFGEVDLVMRDADCLVFVEVRYRTSTTFVSPALTVDARKQSRIQQAARAFLAANPAQADRAVRFDVIAIESAGTIQWIKDAFRS